VKEESTSFVTGKISACTLVEDNASIAIAIKKFDFFGLLLTSDKPSRSILLCFTQASMHL